MSIVPLRFGCWPFMQGLEVVAARSKGIHSSIAVYVYSLRRGLMLFCLQSHSTSSLSGIIALTITMTSLLHFKLVQGILFHLQMQCIGM
jgi:hypothetical protein